MGKRGGSPVVLQERSETSRLCRKRSSAKRAHPAHPARHLKEPEQPHLMLGPTVLLMMPVSRAIKNASHTMRSTGALMSTQSGGVPASVHTPAHAGRQRG